MRKIIRLEDMIEELSELEDLREPWKIKHKMELACLLLLRVAMI